MSKKYTYKQGFKPKDEIQISIIKKDIPGLHGDLIPKVQLVMDAWLKYSTLKQYLVDKYSDVPPFNGEPFTEATPKRSELYEKVLTILKKIPIADNPNGCDRYGIDSACAELEDVFIKESLKNRPTSSEQKPSEDVSKGAEETLEKYFPDFSVNEMNDFRESGGYKVIISAMQEFAQQSMKHERDRAIQECIDIVKKCAGFESHHIAASRINSVAAELEKLKSKTI